MQSANRTSISCIRIPRTTLRLRARYVIPTATDHKDDVEQDFTSFVKQIRSNEIAEVRISPNSSTVKYSVSDGEVNIEKKTNIYMTEKLLDDMLDHNVKVHIDTPPTFLHGAFLIISVVAFYTFLFKTFGQIFNRGEFFKRQQEKTTEVVQFEDIAGIDEVINEVNEYVDFLKCPSKYADAGAQIPAGCLLHGHPGTGKTMIAKAIASEAGVPFISCSASEFVELFVGMGASRVRNIFAQARKQSPCILFIDEIDAIGKKRSTNELTSNDEREQTLNQILTEMDGFESNNGVIVMAATNRIDTLDDALIRPGRFDRKIAVPLPNKSSRTKILQVYSKTKTLEEDVDLEKISTLTPGSSGADLKVILNEAAIKAARENKVSISADDITYAIEKVTIGLPRKSTYTTEEKKRVAVHEIGHALIATSFANFDSLDKVSILPIGRAGGITSLLPNENDLSLYTFDYLKKKIKVALGGYACEEVIFGRNNVSTGATSDIQIVTRIATNLVSDYGYSKQIGKTAVEFNLASEMSKYEVEKEMQSIVSKAYSEVFHFLKRNSALILELSEVLIEKDTLTGIEFRDIISKRTFQYHADSTRL